MTTFVLSLVIATYKREQYLCETIKTIFDSIKQSETKRLIEIVVVNNDIDCDINSVLENIKSVSLDQCAVRTINNKKNYGMDRSQLIGLSKASGKYILLCSDRYSYCLDFDDLVSLLDRIDADCIFFSDGFRRFFKAPSNIVESYRDRWISNSLNVLEESVSFFKISTSDDVFKSLLRKGLVHKFSDLIFKNQGPSYYSKFKIFIDSYMLGVAVLLDAVVNRSNTLIFRVPFNASSSISIGDGNTHIRHDYNKVVDGNLMLVDLYPSVFTRDSVLVNQFSALLGLKRGVLTKRVFLDIDLDKRKVNQIYHSIIHKCTLIDRISYIALFRFSSKTYASLLNLIISIKCAFR